MFICVYIYIALIKFYQTIPRNNAESFLPLSRLKNSPLQIWGSEAKVFAISCSIYYCWLLGKLIQMCIKMLIN
jgi:hypothetical protein